MGGQATLMERVFQRAEEMGLGHDLARFSGLSDTRMDAIRRGEPVSSSEFELICRALAVDSGAMHAGTASSPTRSPARFRAATALENPSPADLRLLALAAEQGRILGHLMGLLRKKVGLRQYRHILAIQGSSELWREGYDLGEAARAALCLDGGPLLDLPRLLNEAGVHVARLPLSSTDIDAASIWEPNAVPVVLINSRSHVLEHPGAFRASLAHELCHLLHDAGERDITTTVSWGIKGTGNYHDNLEVRARAFAPAFLAPRGHVQDWHATLSARTRSDATRLVKNLAETWGLSFEGASWHAKNCGLIKPAEAHHLAELPRKPLLSLEDFEPKVDLYPPAMVHSELPTKAAPLWQGWASELVLEALDEGCVSVGRARELLTWS